MPTNRIKTFQIWISGFYLLSFKIICTLMTHNRAHPGCCLLVLRYSLNLNQLDSHWIEISDPLLTGQSVIFTENQWKTTDCPVRMGLLILIPWKSHWFRFIDSNPEIKTIRAVRTISVMGNRVVVIYSLILIIHLLSLEEFICMHKKRKYAQF